MRLVARLRLISAHCSSFFDSVYGRSRFVYVELIVDFFRFFFQAEDGIRVTSVTGVQTCALPIYMFAVL